MGAVREVFDELGYAYVEVGGRGDVIEAGFEAHHTRIYVHVQVFEERGLLIVGGRGSVVLGEMHRRAGAELLMRMNRELVLGSLELDMDSGQVLYRASLLVGGGDVPGRGVIGALVHDAVAELDRATPYVAELGRMGEREMGGLDLRNLLGRSDLAAALPGGSAGGG
jgi:hypothetical protein